MTEDDVAAVAALEARCFGDPWPAQAFRELLADGRHRCLVAGGPELLGYAVGSFVADEGEVLNVAVADAVRRRGVARALLQRLVGELQACGARRLFLEVRESNAAAIGLYRGFGFQPLSRRRGYYRAPREDALTMVWEASWTARK
jgi:ribosomal-protein-alanine N-acetyltransferase